MRSIPIRQQKALAVLISGIALCITMILVGCSGTDNGTSDANNSGNSSSDNPAQAATEVESESNGTPAQAATEEVTGNVISATIPTDGWTLVAGTEWAGGSDDQDRLVQANEIDRTALYLCFYTASTSAESTKESIGDGTEKSGAYIGEETLSNGTWYIWETEGVADLDGTTMMVLAKNGAELTDDDIEEILGTVKVK